MNSAAQFKKLESAYQTLEGFYLGAEGDDSLDKLETAIYNVYDGSNKKVTNEASKLIERLEELVYEAMSKATKEATKHAKKLCY